MFSRDARELEWQIQSFRIKASGDDVFFSSIFQASLSKLNLTYE